MLYTIATKYMHNCIYHCVTVVLSLSMANGFTLYYVTIIFDGSFQSMITLTVRPCTLFLYLADSGIIIM